MTKTTPNSKENDMMTKLMILRQALVVNKDAVRERLRGVPYAWRDLNLAITLVNKLQRALLSTMPDNRVGYYQRISETGRVLVDYPGPARVDHYIIISDRKLSALVASAMDSECALCMREGKEVTRCPLRGALLEVAPPDRVMDSSGIGIGGCEYREAASQLVRGEKVQI